MKYHSLTDTRVPRTAFLFVLAIVILIYSCRYQVSHTFRNNYSNFNELLHSDTVIIPYLKIHFRNGNVSVFEDWRLNFSSDSILGKGKLYDFNRERISEGQLAFAFEEVAIIETNQLDAIQSKDNGRLATLGVLTAANVVGGIACIINPKACFGSCPTFYIEGNSFIHTASAEGFSSSIAPSMERVDVDALQFSTSRRSFSITMKNEALETHMVNELAVHAVPKKQGEHIYHDNLGTYFRCGSVAPCKYAIANGVDILPALGEIDEMEYFSLADSFDLSAQEEIIIGFDHLPSEQSGLVVNFRQSLMTTFLLYSGYSFMGDQVAEYFAKIETGARVRKHLGKLFDRLGGIEFYLWDSKADRWQFIDKIHETGPIARNLVIVPIDDRKQQTREPKIKIKMARGLWRLDYVGLTEIQGEATPQVVYPKFVEVIDGEDYSVDELRYDDDQYLISFPGNEYNLEFGLPEVEGDDEHELFLSAKGYYLEWIREEWIAGKDLPRLKKLIMNDAETWRELALEYKSVEPEMEEVFWNSKYSPIQ